jgi:hypothetical protein
VLRDARFASPAACANCHQFDFPDSTSRRVPEKMQSTIDEHRASPASDRSCASCHMPRVNGHRSHAFAASRSPQMIQSAATVQATRLSPTAVRLTLTPRPGLGHAFPTGDLFRRLAVVASVGNVKKTVYLARHFGDAQQIPGVHVRVTRKDDRVMPGAPRVVDIELGPSAAGKPIAWRVAHQRVENPRSREERDALVDGEILLAEGSALP